MHYVGGCFSVIVGGKNTRETINNREVNQLQQRKMRAKSENGHEP